MRIPDAPYIREAERYGCVDYTVECPVCGNSCETVYRDINGEIIGCNECLQPIDAYDWYHAELAEELDRRRYEEAE